MSQAAQFFIVTSQEPYQRPSAGPSLLLQNFSLALCETANPVQRLEPPLSTPAQLMGWQDRVGSIEPTLEQVF
jgi:hypothetical protein